MSNTHLYQRSFDAVEPYFRAKDVHDAQRVDGEELIALVISLLWSLLHAVNCYWVFWSDLPIIYGAVIHILLAVIIGIIVAVMKSAGSDVRHLSVLAITSLAAGVFGALGTLLSSLLTIIYARFSYDFSQWYATIFPKHIPSHEEWLYEQITMGKDESPRAYTVTPFMDIIALGTEAQKRRAISRMTDHFHPSFADAYKLALTDKSNAIRVQAASSITRIESQFSEMLMKVEGLERSRPEDPVVKLALARFYDSYAFTGLLDDRREHGNRVKSLEKYQEYLEIQPSDIDARIEAGRVLLRSGEYNQVLHLFNDCIQAGFGNDTLKSWMLEALFEAGRYDELRILAAECSPLIKTLHDIRPRLAQSIILWGGVDEHQSA